MPEQEAQNCPQCGYPAKAGHALNCSIQADQSRSIEASHAQLQQEIKSQINEVKIRPEDTNERGELLAWPEGPVSQLAEPDWKMVRTPAFKEWFGDSLVLDAQNEPLVLYHGSKKEFDAFSADKAQTGGGQRDSGFFGTGHYFTPHRSLAEAYGNNIYRTFVRIESIQTFDIDHGNVRYRDKPLPSEIHEEVFRRYEPRRKQRLQEVQERDRRLQAESGGWGYVSSWNGENDFEDVLSETVRDVLKEQGVDGAVGYNPRSKVFEYVAFQDEDILIIPEIKNA